MTKTTLKELYIDYSDVPYIGLTDFTKADMIGKTKRRVPADKMLKTYGDKNVKDYMYDWTKQVLLVQLEQD